MTHSRDAIGIVGDGSSSAVFDEENIKVSGGGVIVAASVPSRSSSAPLTRPRHHRMASRRLWIDLRTGRRFVSFLAARRSGVPISDIVKYRTHGTAPVEVHVTPGPKKLPWTRQNSARAKTN